MRYHLLKPIEPLDPRSLQLSSTAALHAVVPVAVDCETQAEAAESVRLLYPEFVAMVVPVKIGSGTTWMIGILEHSRKRYSDMDEQIPFVLLVKAEPERERDRRLIDQRAHFDQQIWRSHPLDVAADLVNLVATAEIRSTELVSPFNSEVVIGRTADGRLLLTTNVQGHDLSIAFDDKALAMIQISARPVTPSPSEGPVTTLPDGVGIGSSFDPTPWK